MSNQSLFLLLLLLLLFLNLFYISTAAIDSVAVTRAHVSVTTDFIKKSCRATRYPELCVRCLAGYSATIRQSQRQLALTALTVSLVRARSASVFVSRLTRVKGIKPREYKAVKDCIENMGDTVDRLSDSVREIGHMGRTVGHDFMWHMSNVQTWVSAALTDENTCVDGFASRVMDGNVRVAIRRRVSNVAQVTSNALALVNQFAERQQN